MRVRLTLGQVYRISIGVSAACALLIAAFGFFFLYRYLYKTITETEYIVNLQREYAVEPLNFQIFKDLVAGDKERRSRTEPNWSASPDPFRGY